MRSILPALVLSALCGGLAIGIQERRPAESPAAAATTRPAPVLPGIRGDGEVQLPNQWSLRPAGRQLVLGDFPVNMALHPDGQWLAVLHAGYGTHEIVIVNIHARQPSISCRVPLAQTFYGICFSPDGQTLYASGAEYETVHLFRFDKGLLANPRSVAVASIVGKFIPAGLALDTEGKNLFVAGTFGQAVCRVPLDDPRERKQIELGAKSYPYTCLPEPRGKRVFVSLWGKAAVAVLDRDEDKVVATWPTSSHPTEMALSPDGKTLFVACSNSTRVSVLDAHDGKERETINCALYPSAPSGNTPSSLSLSPDGELLFVANAESNNLAVFKVSEPGKAKPLGFIPVGWYPTSVRYNARDKRIYVANGKGLISKANPQGPNPSRRDGNVAPVIEYIARLFHGTLGVIDMPTPKQMAAYSKQAYACSPLRSDAGVTAERPEDNPIPARVGDSSPLRHVIYIIKENRTYDQVFGDLKEGNGEPSLCLFPEKVTPNHHRLARQFVLLDNFYVEGEVSADGHQWSMGAYCTDFVEKVWPLNYRGSPLKKLSEYPSEGNYDSVARPAGGYIWNRCAEADVSYRSYGEWVRNGKTPNDPAEPMDPALKGHIDPQFRSFDMDYPDVKRAERFIEELHRFERDGKMPRLQIVRLPNDHTTGTKPDTPTPRAYLADNDLALGMVVEAVTKSKFWKDTAIFVLEDDAQNGPDHVDAHRSVALVISPYTRRHHVDSTMYSTSSMLRTMELILGLKPMSQFDAAARPMYASFQAKPDMSGYEHVVPDASRTEKNKATAWGAKLSQGFDLTKEDAADDLLLNEVVWRSVKGPHSPMPAPVRAAFVFPHLKGDKADKDDDD